MFPPYSSYCLKVIASDSSIELAFIPHTLDRRDGHNFNSGDWESLQTLSYPHRVGDLRIVFPRIRAHAVLLYYYYFRTQPRHLELDCKKMFINVPRLVPVGVDGAIAPVFFLRSSSWTTTRLLSGRESARCRSFCRYCGSGPAERLPRSPYFWESSFAIRGDTRG